MNHDNINKVIDWLNRGAPEMVFSMRYSLMDIENTCLDDDSDEDYEELPYSEQEKISNGCGSVCCIAGAAAQYAGMKTTDACLDGWSGIQDKALEFFGVTKPEKCRWMLPVFDPDEAPHGCTPQQAAKALKLWADQVYFDIHYNPWDLAE